MAAGLGAPPPSAETIFFPLQRSSEPRRRTLTAEGRIRVGSSRIRPATPASTDIKRHPSAPKGIPVLVAGTVTVAETWAAPAEVAPASAFGTVVVVPPPTTLGLVVVEELEVVVEDTDPVVVGLVVVLLAG